MLLIGKNSLQGGKNIYLGYGVDLSLYKHQETWQASSQLLSIGGNLIKYRWEVSLVNMA